MSDPFAFIMDKWGIFLIVNHPFDYALNKCLTIGNFKMIFTIWIYYNEYKFLIKNIEVIAWYCI